MGWSERRRYTTYWRSTCEFPRMCSVIVLKVMRVALRMKVVRSSVKAEWSGK